MKAAFFLALLPLLISCATNPCSQQYTVKEGEYCYLIAENNGLSLDQFKAINSDVNCDNLQVGAQVCIKASSDPSPPTPDTPSDSDGKLVTFDQFTTAVTGTNNYPAPSQDQYNSFINNYEKAGGITSARELAMFLAEILWESGGLQYKAEIRCKDDGCPNDYRSPGDDPSKFYYGRGYIQLTWSYNYKAASEDLFGDDRLVTDPDQVATNEDIAWQTAFWFWKTNVHSVDGVQNGQFGSATNAINGDLECNPCRGACTNRNDIYAHVLKIFGVNESPNYAGC